MVASQYPHKTPYRNSTGAKIPMTRRIVIIEDGAADDDGGCFLPLVYLVTLACCAGLVGFSFWAVLQVVSL